MISGERYLHSRQKRALDLFVSHSARPAEALATWAARRYFSVTDESLLVQEKRLGGNFTPIFIDKIRTKNDDGSLINELAEVFYELGIDEITQMRQVREGSLSVFGRRPLLPGEEEDALEYTRNIEGGQALVDIYTRLVIPAKPGIFSSFGFRHHADQGGGRAERIRSNVIDHLNASLVYDAGIAIDGITRLLGTKLPAPSLVQHEKLHSRQSVVVTD